MDLGSKLLELRKKNGLSQENLADKLNVSRQTISKWELGESSPDISQAKSITKIFKISLDDLVDNDIINILEERISNTEKLAAMIMKIFKITGVLMIIFIIGYIFYFVRYASTYAWFIGGTGIYCSIEDKTYHYQLELETIVEEKSFSQTVMKPTHKIVNIEKIGGNAYLSNIIDLEKYEYDYHLLDAINAYFSENGGKCENSDFNP